METEVCFGLFFFIRECPLWELQTSIEVLLYLQSKLLCLEANCSEVNNCSLEKNRKEKKKVRFCYSNLKEK